jgi:hypothetical protein
MSTEYMRKILTEQRQRDIKFALDRAVKELDRIKTELGDELCGILAYSPEDARKEILKSFEGVGFNLEELFAEAKKRREKELKSYVGGARHVIRNS